MEGSRRPRRSSHAMWPEQSRELCQLTSDEAGASCTRYQQPIRQAQSWEVHSPVNRTLVIFAVLCVVSVCFVLQVQQFQIRFLQSCQKQQTSMKLNPHPFIHPKQRPSPRKRLTDPHSPPVPNPASIHTATNPLSGVMLTYHQPAEPARGPHAITAAAPCAISAGAGSGRA